MKPWRQLVLLVCIALAAAGATWWHKGPPNRLFHCDPAALKPDEVCLESIPADAAVVWIDARPRAAWQKSGVPGSLLWNLDPAEDMQAFEAAAAVRIAVTPRVIVYCSDENCGVSRQVAARIRSLDLGAQVAVLRGGWRALSEAGRVKK
ncbi:MAG: rhodanese-like domain-containing protein [Verrucomicrobiota bacterium]